VSIDNLLVIGLGSMGKRRVRNLQSIGVSTITGFDPRPDRREETSEAYGIRTVASVEEGFGLRPDAVVVSTPPDLHVTYAREAVRMGLPVFMEASVVDDEVTLLADEAVAKRVLVAPSCTMRFHPSVQTIKRLVDEDRIGRVLTFTHHSAEYLPDWHPWEDYRYFYAGQRSTGACREIVPFELLWLTWILGPVGRVAAMKGKVGNLEVDIDDTYQLLVQTKAGALGHLLVDVLARAPIRRCTLVGSQGTITWDVSEKSVRLYEAEAKTWTSFREQEGTVQPGYRHAEEPYVDEMRAYLAAARGESAWPYSLSDDMLTLGLLRAAERSSDEGVHVEMSDR
jgi:predicted dehydrogenase